VRDTGIGIGPEALSRVFDAFTQVDDSYARRFGGTGLGLAICRRLAALMGGEVGATSAPGQGSTFWVELPLEIEAVRAPLDAGATQALLEQDADTGASRIGNPQTLQGRLLVAEDNEINQLVISEMLTLLGVEYVLAGNGRDAVAAARSGEFDLVLMDCQMPVMDGYAATRELRAIAAHGRDGQPLPIVALTANAFDDDRARAAEVGMDAFLSKPVRLDDLRAMLARWLPAAEVSEPAAARAARCT
jgi:CheY-like chemotaxis protein